MSNFEDIVLSESQQNIIDSFPGFLLSEDREFTISGYAGSGKTFLVQYLTKMAPAQQKMVELLDPSIKPRRFIYTATTNKAAEVLRGTVNEGTSTIHRALGLKVKNNYKTGKQELICTRGIVPLRNSIIFIDEASMINDVLLTRIRDVIRKTADCKIVYIGDEYQLPPIKEDICPVFQKTKNKHFLQEIHRQVKDSPIIKLASHYRKMLDDTDLSWPEIPYDDEIIFKYDDKDKYFDALRKAYTAPHGPNDLKILAWSNKRVHRYNDWIRKLLGAVDPIEPGETVITNKPLFFGKTIMAMTDRILEVDQVRKGEDRIPTEVTANTSFALDGYWVSFKNFGPDSEVFMPANWHQANALCKQLKRDTNWKPFFYIKEHWADLRPIHASTVHKAQGSTYKEVFIDLSDMVTSRLTIQKKKA
jgi:hypothetical protein